MKKLLAFTLAEAILTMTILGVIAATMVSSMKPAQYRKKGLVTKAQKVYSEVDNAINMAISECTQDLTLDTTYKSCSRSDSRDTIFKFSAAEMNAIFGRYMRFLSTTCTGGSSLSVKSCYLVKNGACVCFNNNGSNAASVWVDVNNGEGPNTTDDRYEWTIDKNGLAAAMPSDIVAGAN